MRKTFAEELKSANKNLYNNPYLKKEFDRIHQEVIRDKHHAFCNVIIRKPDPWKNLTRTDLTI